jgi:uncharacterized protein
LKIVSDRYRGLGSEPYWFAWFKLRLDPMFLSLADLVGSAEHVLDLGAGYGVPAVWLLAQNPGLRVTAVESDPVRAHVAAWAIGDRGSVLDCDLLALPESIPQADAVLLIDVAHYLSDSALGELCRLVTRRLVPGGLFLLRDTVPSTRLLPWERRLEGWRLTRRGVLPRFRSAEALVSELRNSGYDVELEPIRRREETWLAARLRSVSTESASV